MEPINHERRQEIVDSYSPAALEYLDFISYELSVTEGSLFFRVHHVAPDDVTEEQLAVMAQGLKDGGWNAEVVPIKEAGDEKPAILISSSE